MKVTLSALFLSVLLVLAGCNDKLYSDESLMAEIETVLRTQEKAWNKGDIEGFMAGYAKSDSTLFAGKTRVNLGWQKVLDQYKKSYPDAAAMGKLQFDLIRIKVLSEKDAYVVGKWTLTETGQAASGHFVLIIEKGPDGWKITVDGTS